MTRKAKIIAIRKAKIKNNGAIHIEYRTDDRTNQQDDLTREGKDPVHPDLQEAFQALKPALIATYSLNWPSQYLAENLFSTDEGKAAAKVVNKDLKKAQKLIDESVQVTGFSAFGEGEGSGVVVTGTFESKGMKKGISSHRIMIGEEASTWGFEQQLAIDLDNCQNEVKLYLNEGKIGETTAEIEFEEEPEEDDLEEKSNGRRGRLKKA